MKKMIIFFVLAIATDAFAQVGQVLACNEMDEAASSISKINGGTFASPSYRVAPIPVMTEGGAEFRYQFDAYLNRGDELPNKKIGIVQVYALIRTGQVKCKVLSINFKEQ